MDLNEYEQNKTHRICLFGRAKIGKTAIAAQIARIKDAKLWWFDLEDGIKTILNPAILPPEFRKNFSLFRIPSFTSIPMAAETILKLLDGKEKMICWEHGKVACGACMKAQAKINRICLSEFTINDWLVIDSITQLTSDVNAAVLKKVITGMIEPEHFILEGGDGKNFKYPMAVSMILDKIFTTFQASNLNVVVISHEVMTEQLKDTGHLADARENQPNTGVEMVFPAAGSRNYSRNFGRFFDALIHVDIVNGKHRAFSKTTYSNKTQTGSRIGNIEDQLGADGKPLPPGEALVKLLERKA